MRRSASNLIGGTLLVLILLGLPVTALVYQAHRTGQSVGGFLSRLIHREDSAGETFSMPANPKGPRIDFLRPIPVGNMSSNPPRITHLIIEDLDKDGLKDIVACDALADTVCWIRQHTPGQYSEIQLGDTIRTPAHVSACDIDKDGDPDLLVASMGMLFPNNDKIGAIVVLENEGNQHFTNHVLAEGIARVTDVQGGDLDGDGDIDLAVGQFGYDDGEIRWMKNNGEWQFESHILLRLSGTIHTPIVDLDGDGDLDIAALVSQEWEEITLFVNDGKGKFETRQIYGSTNEDFGSSGISPVDLDQDGDVDLLYTNGDAFDYLPPGPRPWHGLQWLENQGHLTFKFHRIANVPGAYSAQAVDVDKDGDLDVFVVSAFNNWRDPAAQSFLWFENDGQQNFVEHDLASQPTHLLVLAADDMNQDGEIDFVTGGMHVYPPYDRMSRIMLWLNEWPQRRTGDAAP